MLDLVEEVLSPVGRVVRLDVSLNPRGDVAQEDFARLSNVSVIDPRLFDPFLLAEPINELRGV